MGSAYVRNNFLSDEISVYVAEHTTPPDEVQVELREVTRERFGRSSVMQIGDDQAVLIEVLVRSIGARRAIEVGTFTGYSAIAIAKGLGEGGHLLCCDVSEEWTSVAREYWKREGLSDRIELRIAPAIETLRSLPTDEVIDFAYVDADKDNYSNYYEAIIPLIRPGGLFLADNTLRDGRVVDESANDPGTIAMRQFNDRVCNDERVLSVLLPFADGVTVIQKR